MKTLRTQVFPRSCSVQIVHVLFPLLRVSSHYSLKTNAWNEVRAADFNTVWRREQIYSRIRREQIYSRWMQQIYNGCGLKPYGVFIFVDLSGPRGMGLPNWTENCPISLKTYEVYKHSIFLLIERSWLVAVSHIRNVFIHVLVDAFRRDLLTWRILDEPPH